MWYLRQNILQPGVVALGPYDTAEEAWGSIDGVPGPHVQVFYTTKAIEPSAPRPRTDGFNPTSVDTPAEVIPRKRDYGVS